MFVMAFTIVWGGDEDFTVVYISSIHMGIRASGSGNNDSFRSRYNR